MFLRIVTCSFIFFFLAIANLSAQTLLADNEVLEATTLHMVSDSEDGIFFTDPESKVCYIDFDQIDGYAKHLIVKEDGGDVLIDEALWELSPNTIYELDFEEFSSGKYKVELHTYSTVIKKDLDVR